MMTRFMHLVAAFFLLVGTALAFTSSSPRTSPLHLLHRSSSASTATLQAQKEATFGMGCFWKPAEELLKVPGVIDTVAGYTGGNPQSSTSITPPTYDSVCFGRDSWVEGVRVIYDDEQISYNELLDKFFEEQEPKLARQYASIIFPHDDQQEQLSREWLQKNQARVRRDGIPAAITEIEPLSSFYKAEEYHQRYWDKTKLRFGLVAVFTAVASGALDQLVASDSSAELQSTLHTAGNGIALAILMFMLLERRLDTKVVKL